MIADSRKIQDFIDAIQGRNYEEILLMAIAEATAAERMMYKHRSRDDSQPAPGTHYSRDLKRLIAYMRYGLKPPGFTAGHLASFSALPSAPRRGQQLQS